MPDRDDSHATTDPRAVERVWRAFSEGLRAWFSTRVRQPADVDDLLQETFLRVQRRLGTLRDDERLAGWVHTLARNVLVDHYRRRHPDDGLDGEALRDADDTTPRDAVLTRVGRWLPAAIDDLPPAYREALRLAELEELPYAQIAERLGLSLSGVKSRVARGRARLQAKLLACCALELDRRGGVVAMHPKHEEPRCCDRGDRPSAT